MKHEKLILFLNIIAALLYVSHAKIKKFSIPSALHVYGVSDEDILLDILEEENEVKEIKKLMSYIDKVRGILRLAVVMFDEYFHSLPGIFDFFGVCVGNRETAKSSCSHIQNP